MKRQRLSLVQRMQMIDYLVKQAEKDGKEPLTIAIYDDARQLISLTMMDGSDKINKDLACRKAYTSSLMRKRTKTWQEFIEKQQVGLDVFGDPQMTIIPGGAPIINSDGDTLGSIGISGRTMKEDQELADAAVQLLKI